jgi:pseudouridine synthase
MIRQGRVAVNGQVVTVMGVTVDPHADSITVDGKPLGRADRKRTYLFYKPPGVICTREDTHGRKTVFDILPDEVGTGLHSAGRLDMDAEGLLILTNDGELTRKLTHPSSHLPKTYLVKVKGEVQLNALKKLRRGVDLEDGVTLPASVSVIKGHGTERNTWLRIVLREGRKNQIKRMGEAVGHRVMSIKRVSIGGTLLPEKMKPGSFKKMSRKEIETLIGGKEKHVQRSTFNVQRGKSGQSVESRGQREQPDAGTPFDPALGGTQGRRRRGDAEFKPKPGPRKSTTRKASGGSRRSEQEEWSTKRPSAATDASRPAMAERKDGKQRPTSNVQRAGSVQGSEFRGQRERSGQSPKSKEQRGRPKKSTKRGDSRTSGRGSSTSRRGEGGTQRRGRT